MSSMKKLQKRGKNFLPFDCWCEVIPFMGRRKDLMSLLLSFKGLMNFVGCVNPQCTINACFCLRRRIECCKFVTNLHVVNLVELFPSCKDTEISNDTVMEVLNWLSETFPNLLKLSFGSSACQNWSWQSKAVQELQKHMLFKFTNIFMNLQELVINVNNHSIAIDQASFLPRLRNLTLCGHSGGSRAKVQIDSWMILQNLDRFFARRCYINLKSTSLSDIRHIHLENCEGITNTTPITLKSFEQIKSIHLHSSSLSYISAIENCPKLEKITLTVDLEYGICVQDSLKEINISISNNPNLKNIHITTTRNNYSQGSKEYTYDEDYTKHGFQIKTPLFKNASKINLLNLPRLEHLNCSTQQRGLGKGSILHIRMLSVMPSLKILDLHEDFIRINCSSVKLVHSEKKKGTYERRVNRVGCIPNLTKLFISEISNKLFFLSEFMYLNKLQEIRVRNTLKLSKFWYPRGIVLRNLPNLKIFDGVGSSYRFSQVFNCTSLETLKFEANLSNSTRKEIVLRNLPSLKHLDVDNPQFAAEIARAFFREISTVGRLPNLTSLCLRRFKCFHHPLGAGGNEQLFNRLVEVEFSFGSNFVWDGCGNTLVERIFIDSSFGAIMVKNHPKLKTFMYHQASCRSKDCGKVKLKNMARTSWFSLSNCKVLSYAFLGFSPYISGSMGGGEVLKNSVRNRKPMYFHLSKLPRLDILSLAGDVPSFDYCINGRTVHIKVLKVSLSSKYDYLYSKEGRTKEEIKRKFPVKPFCVERPLRKKLPVTDKTFPHLEVLYIHDSRHCLPYGQRCFSLFGDDHDLERVQNCKKLKKIVFNNDPQHRKILGRLPRTGFDVFDIEIFLGRMKEYDHLSKFFDDSINMMDSEKIKDLPNMKSIDELKNPPRSLFHIFNVKEFRERQLGIRNRVINYNVMVFKAEMEELKRKRMDGEPDSD